MARIESTKLKGADAEGHMKEHLDAWLCNGNNNVRIKNENAWKCERLNNEEQTSLIQMRGNFFSSSIKRDKYYKMMI